MSETSVTQWLERVQQGPDNDAEQKLWERYCRRLAGVARRRLREARSRSRSADEADAVQQVFAAFFRRVREGAYPDCRDRNDLWCLLVKIADNKARQLARDERRRKRGGGKVRGDSVFVGSENGSAEGFDQLVRAAADLPLPEPSMDEPDDEFVDRLLDTFVLCYGTLDKMEREVLRGQLQGYTHDEIARQIGCVTRTIERKLKVIRARWREHEA